MCVKYNMTKIVSLLLLMVALNVFAADSAPIYKQTMLAPTVKAMMPRSKKRQMNIYYAFQANEIDNSDPDTGADDLDMHVGYRRPELDYESTPLDIDTIPEHILKRLELARQLAVTRHLELWSSG